jgi:signal transduction histidine kinase
MLYFFSTLLGGLGARTSIYFSALLIVIFAISFQPLRDKIQEFIDKVFFRGKYDYQKTLKELSLVARSIAGLDELLDKVLTAIVSVIKLNNASVYVLDKRGGKYFARKTIGVDIKRALPENDDIIKYLASRKEAVMYDEVSKVPGNISGFMKEIGAAIIFPIITKDELVGFLCLGEKLSGEVYSDEDIDLLTTLCNQMGVSIENAMLYEDALEAQKKLYQADKLATVGALAAGLAHEIKNPIAAIKGFSQVIGKAVEENDAEAIKDFKDVVPRQLDRINEIVEKLLTLSRPPKLEKKKIDINVLLNEIVRLVEKQALKQRVEIVKSFEDLPQTLADPEQLTQAFLNLILNAIQSMPDGGQIEIRTKFMGTDRIVVEIIDNGMGIPKEKRSKIFDPFYTTKAGGSGLGLSVTQKIIIDHHGKIEVDSEVGKGTAFTVVLPIVD